jgi:hypothetical protein
MKNLTSLPGFIILIFSLISLINQPVEAQNRYVEDFSTTLYKDETNTTAFWDVASGELKLYPFQLTVAGSYDSPGLAYNVTLDGDYAYLADQASGLQVIDISDPTNPSLAGTYDTPGNAFGVTIAGDYAYVADWISGLQVIDISDPTNPFLAGSYNTSGHAFEVAIAGDYAYVADYGSGLRVVDISDPTNPTSAGNTATLDYARGVAISGDYAFVAVYNSGLQVIDISDPTSPTPVGAYDTPGTAYAVTIDGDYAYVADYGSGLQVIDISDPTAPTYAGSYDTPGNTFRVSINGDYAYVADWTSGLQVIDISDPTSPAYLDSYDTPGNATGVVIAGNYGYVSDYTSGLQVIRISDPVSPTPVGNYDTPGSAYDVAVSGDYAYVADGSSGLQVINISDPTAPTYAGSYDTPGSAYRVAISGDYAYVADVSSGLQVIDISDPTDPTYAGSYDTPGVAYGVTVSGDYAYVADYGSGLQVIDISDPTAPTYAGSYDTPGSAYGVAVSGDYAYVADYGIGGLQVIDISDPTSPTFAGNYDTPHLAYSVAVSGDYAYVADFSSIGGLQVIDISDPTSPTFAGNYDLTHGAPVCVVVSGDYAYMADYDGLKVINITDPTNPTFARGYNTPGSARGVAVSGDYAYVADYGSGLQVIQVFQSEFDSDNNLGWSLTVYTSDNMILNTRLLTSQMSTVAWELSVDGGLSWQDITSNGSWNQMAVPGTDLLWRSTHIWAAPGVNPSVTQLEIDWINEAAFIDSIVDVPDDQGSWLRIYFTRSGRDFVDETTYPVTSYYVFRRIDDIGLQKRIINQVQIPEERQVKISDLNGKSTAVPKTIANSPVYCLEGRYFLISGTQSVQDLPPGTWEVVGSVPAHQEDQYICLVPSLADSATELIYSVYCISAESTTPSVFYLSPPDSGYSIDNIAPSPPPTLNTTQVGNHSVELVWNSNRTDHDWHYFAVHRSLTPDFSPDASSFLANTIDTVFMDNDPYDMVNSYYKIVSYDAHGNPSLPSVQAVIYFDSSLPVTLLTFEAELNSTGTVTISFSTASEINMAGYNIWRSESENEGFTMRASYLNHPELAAKGSSTQGSEYSWPDMTTESNMTYWYKLECVELSGLKYFYGPISVEVNLIPVKYSLYQNYPNPFNAVTNIRYSLPNDCHVVLEIWNLQGQKVATLINGEQKAGYKYARWNANSFASGIYFYRLKTENFVQAKRMQLMK